MSEPTATYKQLNYISNLLHDTGEDFLSACDVLGIEAAQTSDLTIREASDLINYLKEQQEGSTD